MNGLYLDRKAVKLFVILLAVTVVASIGIAAVSHVYFGHETEGKATEFNEGLTLGSSFSLEDIIKDQDYGYKWVTGDNVEVDVYAQDSSGSLGRTDGILQYDPDSRQFTVIGVSEGQITFTSTEDRSVKFTVPFRTTFKETVVRNMVVDGMKEASFVKSGVMTASDLATITKLSTNAAGEVDFSDLRHFTGMQRLIFSNPSEIVIIKGNTLPNNIDILVSSSNVGDYSDYYAGSDYISHIFTNTETEVSVNCITNGGTLVNSDSGQFVVPNDSPVSVPDLFAVSRLGYAFQGWYMAGTDTHVDGHYVFTRNTALEARWTPVSYTVNVHYDNGSGITKTRTLEYDGPAYDPFEGGSPIYDGYSFQGWSRVSNGTVPEYARNLSNVSLVDGDEVDLHAVWIKDTYRIRYNIDNSHKELTGNIPCGDRVTISVSSTNMARLNDMGPFIGWNTDPSVKSADYVQGGEYDGFLVDPGKSGMLDLYPVFNENQYTVVYVVGEGKGTPVSEVHSVGETYDLSTDTTRTGYKLTGWYDPILKKTYAVHNATPVVDGLRLELHAVWDVNKFRVELRTGNYVVGEGTIGYGGQMSFVVSHPYGKMIGGSYGGYALGKYNYDTSIYTLRSNDVNYIYSKLVAGTTDQEFAPTAPAVISMSEYAKTVRVTFVNTDDDKTVEVAYGGSYPFPSATAPKDYHFDRWERSETGGVKKLGTDKAVDLDYDHTVTAVYAENGCVTAGTVVTMADGTPRNIEDIRIGDELMAFDHQSGTWVGAPVVHVFSIEEGNHSVLTLHFDDGTSVNVYQAHGFFDVDTNRYETIDADNVESYVGDRFVRVDGGAISHVRLASYEETVMTTAIYSVITACCINSVCQGMLAVPDDIPGLINIFDYTDGMAYDPEDISASLDLYGYEDYGNWEQYVSEEEFLAFNGQYVNVMIGKGLTTEEGIMSLIGLLREGS